MGQRLMVPLAVLLLLASCSEPTRVEPAGETPSAAKVTPQCLPGCNDDPDDPPTAPAPPGIFISTAVTSTTCFSGAGTDTDQDGLSDRCENDLAAAFAPQLAITGADRTSREPHWAAKGYPASKIVRIAYLLSYHYDDGPSTSWCNNNVPELFSVEGWRKVCSGHYGDSELIVLDVYYNPATQRWLLDCATYSAHESWTLKCRTSTAQSYTFGVVYPDKQGGYPRSYVAYKKHANYFTEAACDSGAMLGTDSCSPTRYERVYAGGNVNIGSRAVHSMWQDCVLTTTPIFASIGKKECYWTVKAFGGWQNYLPQSTAYSTRIQGFGF